ncbi:hypothetical protein L0P88_22975 [Muricauda sp. SCSIO 64092]|uniref:hypothetical protein n=1 Tax=Allomuricauda sp. SCSIO 64092 TaxID=2908842 RepID=UPI001FF26567|nr:hypothetical protein [Muricauda sp. SCSIO 64092]UOY06768.1 hypothetical protein L0P88_22975 [Muricauda sp. SCSIO 64092]
MTPRLRFALTLFATLIGLSVLLLYTTLVEDVLFKGVAFCNADSIQLTFKTLGIGSAGLITGFLTSLLVLQDNYYPNLVLSAAVLAKVLIFVGCEANPSPFWYDLLLSTTLLSGLWMGYYGGIKFPLSPA